MSAGVIWLASIGAIIAGAVAGSLAGGNKRAQVGAGAFMVGAIVVLLVTTGIGLWEAWSPWELTRK